MSKLIGYKNRLWEVIHDFKYTGTDQPFTLQRGTYLFICNGAVGGTLSSNNNNIPRMKERGGTSYGVLTLNSTKTFHAVVGGGGSAPTPNASECHGGFNGGSPGGLSGNPSSSSYVYGAGGGGASDVRLIAYDGNEFPSYDANGNMIDPTTQRKTIGGSYYQVEYIQCFTSNASGVYSSSIQTGYIPKANTKITFDGVVINRTLNNYYAIFGCRSSFTGGNTDTYTNAFEFYTRVNSRNNIARYTRFNGVGVESSEFVYNNRIRLECYKNKAEWFVDGVSKGKIEITDGRAEMDSQYPLVINGTINQSSPSDANNMQIYRFTISEINGNEETIIHDYVPCRQITDKTVFGLYDTVDGVFKQVTTYWTCGPLVTEHPSLNSRIIVAGGAGGSTTVWGDGNSLITSGISSGGGATGHNCMPNYMGIYQLEPNYQLCASQTIGYAFGYSNRPTARTSLNYFGSSDGASGGGGGWYGGFTSQARNTGTDYMSLNGGGGSGYVLTSTSYKPPGYEPSSEYYFTDTAMTAGTSTVGEILICKLVTKYAGGDSIEFPCIGDGERITLTPGSYTFKCYGGDGGYRRYSAYAVRGGYAEGSIMLKQTITTFVHVGGSAFPFWNMGHGNLPVNTHQHTASIASTPQISYNGGGTPNTSDANINQISGGGATDIRFEVDDLNHRVIVAGGAGSEGMHGYGGGAGGGDIGGSPNASGQGTNNGPGTQTSSPSDQNVTVAGSFGQGGHSVYYANGYGGAGGGGWYGGSGTYPNGNSDNDKGGAGGSGYVLTEDSYKPSGYAFADNKYGFTETTMTTGGNTLELFQTKAVIEVIGTMRPVICHDAMGYKRFDVDENAWVLLDPQPYAVTPDLFTTYDSSIFLNDAGLSSIYDVYVFDQTHGTQSLVMNVVPPRQMVSYILEMRGMIKDIVVDAIDYNPEQYAIGVIPAIDIDDDHKQINVVIDKFGPTTEPMSIYSAQIQSTGNYGSHKYINPDGKWDYYTYDRDKKEIVHDRRKFEYRDPEDYRDETGRIMTAQWLLPVGKGNRIPTSYRNDVCENDMVHICCSTFAEHNRTIYLAYLMSTANSSSSQYIYFVIKSVSMMTGNIQHVYRMSWSNLTGQTGSDAVNMGGFLVDGRFFYVAYGNGATSFVKINRSTFEVTRSSTISAGLRFFGKLQWYDSNTIAAMTYSGMYLYDTYENTWTRLIVYSFNNSYPPGDFCIGKKYILFGYNSAAGYSDGSDRRVMAYNRSTKTISTHALVVDGRPSICYDGDSKFYVVQKGRVYDFDETTGELGTPTVASVIQDFNACSYTNHGVIIFNYGSTNLTVFNTEQKLYQSVYLPWTLGTNGRSNWSVSGTDGRYGIFSGFAINGFYFLMGYTMLTMNYTGNAKYNMGYKFNQYMIFYNTEHEDYIAYDDRFITVDEASVSLHDGDIVFEFGDYSSNHITRTCVDKKQYTYINRISIQ